MEKTTLALFVFLMLVAFVLTFFVSGGVEAACEYEWIDPKCDDGDLLNGYWWKEFWVPGFITAESHMVPQPRYTKGWAVSYSPGIMEATAAYMGFDLADYKDGVALMSCADVGHTIWIRRWRSWDPEIYYEWDGPFLVVDCAEWDDHYPIAMYHGEIVEIGYKTAERWGWVTRDWQGLHYKKYIEFVQVWKGPEAPDRILTDPIVYSSWFSNIVEFQPDWRGWWDKKPIFQLPHEWLIGGEWIDFVSDEIWKWKVLEFRQDYAINWIWKYRLFIQP